MTSVAYSRSVMRLLAELRGPDATVSLSPRDWALLFDWERRGVPLATVLEALREGPPDRRSRRGRAGPLRVSDVASAVEEAWQVLRSGRSTPAGAGPTRALASAGTWREVHGSLDPASPLAALLDGLLARAERGADPAHLDGELDEGVTGAAPADARQAVEAEVERDLAPFRSLMSPDALGATRTLAVRDRLRARLGLRRIS